MPEDIILLNLRKRINLIHRMHQHLMQLILLVIAVWRIHLANYFFQGMWLVHPVVAEPKEAVFFSNMEHRNLLLRMDIVVAKF